MKERVRHFRLHSVYLWMSGLTNGDIVAYDGGHHIALRIVPGNVHGHPVLDVTVAANLYAVDVSCDIS